MQVGYFPKMTVLCESAGDVLFVTVNGDCAEDEVVAAAQRALASQAPGTIRFLALEHDGGNLAFSPQGLRRLAQLPLFSPDLNPSWLLILADEGHGELARLMYVYGSVWADAPKVFGNRSAALSWAAQQAPALPMAPPGHGAAGPG